MNKTLLLFSIFLISFFWKGSAQTAAPALNSFSDSVIGNYILLNIVFVPHDTGRITAQVILQQGTGTSVYDSTFVLTSHTVLGTDSATIYAGPVQVCGALTLDFDMGNDSLQGIEYNPLDSVTVVCSDVEVLPMDNFSLYTYGHRVEINSKKLPPNGVAEIFDMMGRKITSVHLSQSVENINLNIPNGIYLVRITEEGQVMYGSKIDLY